MRVLILALGSRGDTQPCAALALELARRGHEPTLAAAARYAPLIAAARPAPPAAAVAAAPPAAAARPAPPAVAAHVPPAGRHGVRFVPLSVDPAAVLDSEEGRAWLGGGPLGFVRGLRTVVEPLAAELVAEVDAACAGADLVLAPALGAFGRHLRERHGVPYRILQFQPSEPTGAFPNPLVPVATLGRLGNRASYALVERAGLLVLRGLMNRLRAGVLGLGPLRGSPFAADRRARVPVLCGVSPLVVPRPRDWPGYVHLTGYWRLPGRDVPGELKDFLAAGPPPVFVGFGSMPCPERVAEEVVAALRLAGLRGVVQGLPVAAADDLLPVGEVAHDLLFPRMAAVVHHGGAGTTGTALAAGVPGVVCPFFSDQPFWGRRVAALGAGPPPLPVRRLGRRELAGRLRAGPEHRERAARLGRLLRAENGAAVAIDLIERH
ncbi:glycosyltransferase [Actinomadura sp. ATCC 31491]|uniref:Glycosyltransferase n=1 Tax=Actinomadura luzonensis TaxID=2805427 RepID=A0ABT0FMF4_9ACTN|nr:glycosyltransferase [Actinomadura luzonensis]MCK2213519.1 glycosyltransferase [Actinomadura luzonensis]